MPTPMLGGFGRPSARTKLLGLPERRVSTTKLAGLFPIFSTVTAKFDHLSLTFNTSILEMISHERLLATKEPLAMLNDSQLNKRAVRLITAVASLKIVSKPRRSNRLSSGIRIPMLGSAGQSQRILPSIGKYRLLKASRAGMERFEFWPGSNNHGFPRLCGV